MSDSGDDRRLDILALWEHGFRAGFVAGLVLGGAVGAAVMAWVIG